MSIRIASLLASGTEIVCGLGLADSLVAISHECDHPPEALRNPRVTAARIDAAAASANIDASVQAFVQAGIPLYELDLARLVELKPDLIITQSQCEVCAVSEADVLTSVARTDALREARVVSLSAMTLEGLYDDILSVASAARCPDRGNDYVQRLQGRVETVRRQSHRLTAQERPSVACIEWIEPLMFAAHWMPQLVSLAGGRYQLAEPGARSTYGSWTDLANCDPQVLIISPCGFDVQRTLRETAVLKERPEWKRLSAVRNRCVIVVDGNAYFNRSGPRLVDSLELLAALLHRDQSPDGFERGTLGAYLA